MRLRLGQLESYAACGALMTLFLGSIGCGKVQRDSTPRIEFTLVPKAASGGPDDLAAIEGTVSKAKKGQRIVLFARSGIWWVQPLANAPFTAIQPDSRWTNTTHYGSEYAALLVDQSYVPPQTTDTLPATGGPVAAVAVTGGGRPGAPTAKTIPFSGYEWEPRVAPSDRGGTMNVYDPANVWTDERGSLHLKIARNGSKWSCAEVKLQRSLGYGTYTFLTRNDVQFEPATVLGLYTWDDSGAEQNHREMDIEITRWGEALSKNAQYVIQPYYVPANVVRFLAPPGPLVHSLHWESGRALFKTVKNDFAGGAHNVAQTEFTSGIPTPGSESVRIAFYVYGKARNSQQQDSEVVIDKFEYLP